MSAGIDAVTGIVTAQTGDAVAGVAESSNAEVWQQWGFASIPSPPIGGQNGAQALILKRGIVDIIFGGRDARAGQVYGNLKNGEVCVFATGADGKAQARTIYKADGSVTNFTTDSNTAGGNAVFTRISPTDGFEVVSPWGKMSLGPNGFHLTSGAAQFSLGSVQGLPGPMGALGSYSTTTAAVITEDAAAVFLGSSKSPLSYNPVAYGLSANPLTVPPVPILNGVPGTPNGLICTGQVFVGAP
jgi:hypothetical protein